MGRYDVQSPGNQQGLRNCLEFLVSVCDTLIHFNISSFTGLRFVLVFICRFLIQVLVLNITL